MNKIKYCIASPHKDDSWYDFRLYENLRESLAKLGYVHEAGAKNRIYFLGAPLKKHYPKVGQFDQDANNIALIYCHLQKIHSLREFQHVFVASDFAKAFFQRRKYQDWIKGKFNSPFSSTTPIEIIKPFSSLSPSISAREQFFCDLCFIGVPRIRPIVEDILPIVEKHRLDFQIIGPSWQNYAGHPKAKAYCVTSSVPYYDLPFVANGAKINLVDHHDSMKKQGMVSHKYVDLIAAGGFVICDENIDAKKNYNGIVYRNAKELEALVVEYLNDAKKREGKRREQLDIVASLTTERAAKDLARKFTS